jgi:hypothetical protein
MKRFMYFGGMLFLAFVLGFGLTGCFSAPAPAPAIYSAGEALDAIGSSRVTELQYVAGKSIELVLMRTKNGQLDTNAVINKNGEVTYTRETIWIPFGTKGLVVERKTLEGGQLLLGVAFEEDVSKLLWFTQTTTELAPFTHFVLLLDETSTENAPIVKYGNSYYWVRFGSDSILAVTEKNSKINTQSLKGKKL